ncbi:MAG: asparagine synthase (glutamine-hydrolyzing) [Puia sp.]|nr:asparagine synthase (glutamine-hydrolyzing) [Puia sp.]
MCGISGIISKNKETDLSSLIRRVNGALSHRGPDADGFFAGEGFAFGHRRLSILDLSPAANQPFTDHSGRYVMVFNGEIYNFREIREQIKEYPFVTTGDTEVVIAAYAKWGPSFLEKLRGMFAIVIWDLREKSLFIARDRFGVKPLYYYQDGSLLLFASEIRALLASEIIPRKLDRTALVDFLKYQSLITPFTIVEGIRQVRAGTWMSYRNGRMEEHVYWDVAARRSPIEEQELPAIHKKIRELLFQSVERRLVSDVPLGAFLSGGIDSSVVVGIMSEVNTGINNAFTIAFDEDEYDESKYAEKVANKFKVSHFRVLLKPRDFLDKLPAALDALDSPSGDGLNTYVVSEAIRKSGITVALSGIGGDELFAGYPIFDQYRRLRQKSFLFDHSLLLRQAAAYLLPAGDQRMQRIKGLLRARSSDIADIYPVFRQIQHEDGLRRLMERDYREKGMTLEKDLQTHRGAIGRFETLSQVSIAEYLGYTQHVLLKDADQMSMASSLELREPFFDHDLVEYVLNVPDRFKYPRYPKSLLVESVKGMLPDEIVFRKKQGFVLPYDLWTRNDLRSFCDEKIRSLAARSYFSEQALLEYWNDYLQGRRHIRWADIWIFIVLEHWLEKHKIE